MTAELAEPVTSAGTPEARRVIYRPPLSLVDRSSHYCPGCGHGIITRLVAELLDEMDLRDRTIGVASVGCSVFEYDYLDVDFVESPHGRAPAVATGVRRVRPEAFVFTYQGDGDLAAIGTAEIIHAAARGERFSVVFVNNGIYGMTGGQLAPTSLLGQKTTSTPLGRDAGTAGVPLPITEMLALLPSVAYAARGSIADPGQIGKTKAMLRRAFEAQLRGGGLSIVEVLSTCPVGWGMTAPDAMRHLSRDVVQTYPPGVLVDRVDGADRSARAGGGRRDLAGPAAAMSTTSIILSGFGGQGLLFAGRVLAQAAVDEGRHVTWLPSYGPEMRGGSAACTVVVSDRPIGSPIVDVADVLIALNPPSLAKYERLVAPGGVIVLNSSLIEAEPQAEAQVVRVPCSALARESGDERVVSIVALGAMVARRAMVSPDSIRRVLASMGASAVSETVAGNLRAFEAGHAAGGTPISVV